MDGEPTVSIRLLNGIGEIDAETWDACAAPEAGAGRAVNPFLTYRWLHAFEESKSAHWREGWDPKHLHAQDEAGETLGVMPLYAKGHSQGEYVSTTAGRRRSSGRGATITPNCSRPRHSPLSPGGACWLIPMPTAISLKPR